MTELTLDVSRTIHASMESVYNAWLDPSLLAKFMIPAEGVTITKAENEAKEGGRFLIVMRTPEQDMPHSGEYLSLNPHTSIVFTWESPYSVDGSTVTISLKAVDEGTQINLHQSKFVSEEARDNHRGGWGSIIVHLEKMLTEVAA